MSPALHAAHEPWSLPIPVTFALVTAAFIHFRGWFRLRRAFPNVISPWQLAAFMSGLFALWIPLGSPLEALDHELLTIHMVKHILLMAVAPPLILLGAPAMLSMHGMPQGSVRGTLRSLLRRPALQRLGRTITHPVFAWLAAMVVLIGWHVPAIFKLGVQSHCWHEIQHASFFATGLLFWWPIVRTGPSVAREPRWHIPLYLFLATLPCDALSAFLVFCDRVVYTSYLTAPRFFNIAPLQDQECAGALMWVCATFIYLVPAVIIAVQLLSPAMAGPVEQTQTDLRRVSARALPAEVEVV